MLDFYSQNFFSLLAYPIFDSFFIFPKDVHNLLYICRYHVTNFFAPSSRFGTPDDLKSLIDKAHELGLLVLMDIVHRLKIKILKAELFPCIYTNDSIESHLRPSVLCLQSFIKQCPRWPKSV